MHTLLIAVGLGLGALGPRKRVATLMLLAALAPFAGFLAAVMFAKLSIAVMAVLFFAGSLFVVLLARTLPRAVLFVVLLLSAPLGGVVIGGAPKWALGVGGIALLAAAVVLAWFWHAGMRVACALVGARLVALGMHGAVPLWQVLAIAAALFVASTFLSRSEQGAPGLGVSTALGVLVGAVLGGGTLAAYGSAPVVTSPRAASLDQGLVWALPSEAITWDDRLGHPLIDNLDAEWLGGPRAARVVKLAGTTLSGRFSLHAEITPRREIKDDAELASLRIAAHAVVEGLRDCLPLIKAGEPEADLARALMDAARKHGCDGGPSFPPIVASGPRAAIPHGTGNDGVLHDGELVMIDIGCYAHGYASDFTRTLAVGKPTERQRQLYDAVYAAQQAAVKACKPGVRLLRNEPSSLNGIARAEIKKRGIEDHNDYGIGHTVGLFVHDVGPTTPLRAGMVITIEPGVYQPRELGIRIEDTYLVTKDGCELLTDGFPSDQLRTSAAPQ